MKKSTKKIDDSAEDINNIQKRLVIGIVVAGLGIFLIAAALFWPNTDMQKSSTSNSSSTTIQDVCSSAGNITFKCYKDELNRITSEHGPEKAMALVKQQYDKVSYVKSQCHQLVHVIGRAALDKYDNIADTYAHGDKYCWSGYYHGAMEEFATQKGYDYLVNNANSVCASIAAKEKNSFYHYNCVHGMGHGFMFVKDSNLFASLESCDALTDSWERTSCYGGAFMQNIINAQAPDRDTSQPLKYLKSSEPMYPCTAVAQKYKDQCYLMQTSYALQTQGYDFKKVFKLCSEVENEFKKTCYTSLGRDASGNSVSNVEQTKNSCLLGPTFEAKKYCIHGAAMDFISYFHSDVQAKELCNSLPANLSSDCLGVVENYYSTF